MSKLEFVHRTSDDDEDYAEEGKEVNYRRSQSYLFLHLPTSKGTC
jgi:hypothetical protein